MRPLLRLVALWMLVAAPVWAQDGDQPITASDLFNIRQLGDVSLSPDGRWLLYTVRQAYREGEDKEAKYGYRTHLWLVDAAGREAPRPLTRGDRSASQPAWHPDGDRIAFVRAVEGTPQVFILPLEGGEAWQLTREKRGASQPRWSPDGAQLLFASSLTEADLREAEGGEPRWPTERPGRKAGDASGADPDPDGSLAEVRAWIDANAADGNPRVLDRLDLQGENDLEPNLRYRHLFVIAPTDSAQARRVTRGWVDFGDGQWIGDGRQIVVSGNTQTRQHPDREQQSNLYLVDVATGRTDRLLQREGYSVFAPAPSPDGAHVAFLQTDLDDRGFAQTEVGVFAVDGRSEPRVLTAHFDRSAGRPTWSPEGRFLYFTAASDGGFPLFRVAPFGAVLDAPDSLLAGDSLVAALPDTLRLPDEAEAVAADTMRADAEEEDAGPAIERLTPFTQGVGSFDVGRSSVYYVVTEVENPNELYRAGLRFDAPRRLTGHNAEWLKTRRVSRPRAYTYVTEDSLTIPYWVIQPTFGRTGTRYPLMLEMHGGPSAMWGPGEFSMWHEFQLFAARGYGIAFGNPRGSGGYGHDFQHANFQNWGSGPAADVLGIADRAAALPWVDASRQVVTGGSYAGYLTAWIVGHDHRFKAAVAQRGVYDLRTFFGEGNAWRLVPTHFGGHPWDSTWVEVAVVDTAASAPMLALAADTVATDAALALVPTDSTVVEAAVYRRERVAMRDILDRESPLTYVAQIQTPLLIIHGDSDRRTGFVQSEMLFRSLKALGRPVEYVRYPGAGHELSRSGDPKQRLDRLLRIYEFMERYVH